MIYTYKTKTGQPLFVPGVGATNDEGVIRSTGKIENPNLELIDSSEADASVNHMNGVVHQDQQPLAKTESESEDITNV